MFVAGTQNSFNRRNHRNRGVLLHRNLGVLQMRSVSQMDLCEFFWAPAYYFKVVSLGKWL